MAEVTEEVSVVGRSRMHIHEGMVEWLEAEHGVDLGELTPAEIIAVAFARRNEWRKSDQYATVKADYEEKAAAVAEERAAAREAAKAERAAAKEAAAAERAAAKEAATEGKPKATKKAAAKKATPGKKAPRRGKATDSSDDPFED